MERMVRKQVYIDASQDQELKRRAAEAGLSEAEIIRASLDAMFKALGRGENPGAPGFSIKESSVAYLTQEERMAQRIRGSLARKGTKAAGAVLTTEDRKAWEQQLVFMEARSRLGGAGKREWTREELYEERA